MVGACCLWAPSNKLLLVEGDSVEDRARRRVLHVVREIAQDPQGVFQAVGHVEILPCARRAYSCASIDCVVHSLRHAIEAEWPRRGTRLGAEHESAATAQRRAPRK